MPDYTTDAQACLRAERISIKGDPQQTKRALVSSVFNPRLLFYGLHAPRKDHMCRMSKSETRGQVKARQNTYSGLSMRTISSYYSQHSSTHDNEERFTARSTNLCRSL